MPVKKYRSVQDMEGNTWEAPGSLKLFAAMRSTWLLAARTIRPRFPPGVYKHRSIADAEALQRTWAQRNFEAFRQRRRQTTDG